MNRSTRTTKILAVIAVIAAGAGFGWYELSKGTARRAEASSEPAPQPRRIFCTGLVEPIHGQIDVMAQLSGELAEVRVSEGDWVEKGDVLAVIDAKREAAAVATAETNLALARAKLARVQAGTGNEEVLEAAFAMQAAGAQLGKQRARVKRLSEDYDEGTDKPPELEAAEFELQGVSSQYESARMGYEALRRGPLPEDVEAAKAAVALAEKHLEQVRVNYDYYRVTAPTSGTVLQVCCHAGDTVAVGTPTPLVRMADTDELRLRLEVDEAEVHVLRPEMEGGFTVRGSAGHAGRLVIRRTIPLFGPKRLFNPDTSARVDTRTLELLCEVTSSDVTLYPGQRITAEFEVRGAALSWLSRPEARAGDDRGSG